MRWEFLIVEVLGFAVIALVIVVKVFLLLVVPQVERMIAIRDAHRQWKRTQAMPAPEVFKRLPGRDATPS